MPVGILLEREMGRIIAVFATLIAGSPYLPLEPALPVERLAELVGSVSASIVITRQELLPRPATLPIATLCLDDDSRVVPDRRAPLAPVTPSNLAYVMYTSGSTGRPKGVMIEHHAAAWYARCAVEIFSLTPSDRVLQFTTLSSDISVEEIFPILSLGGTLVVFPSRDLPTPREYFAVCRAEAITALQLATAYWHELVREAVELPETLPPALRLLCVGGETLRPDRAASWQQQAPGKLVLNVYGPTETTVSATIYSLGSEPWNPGADVPLGRPIPGARAFVLDRGFELLPPGVPGSSCSVAKGSRAAISGGPRRPPGNSFRTRSGAGADDSTGPETSRASGRTACWISWIGSTTR